MKPLYPVLLSMLFCTPAFAQSQKQLERKARIDSSYQRYAQSKLTVKLNLLSLFDPETPTVQTGAEYRISNKVSAELTFGIPVPLHGSTRNTDTTYYRYYKLRAEMRFFPFERKAFYLAPELTYVSKERSRYNGTFYAKDNDSYIYDFAEIDKSIIAGALKLGVVSPFRRNNRWIIDGFIGFGPRVRKVKINAVNPQPGQVGWLNWSTDREGSTTGFHITTGIKFGYVIF